jgi:hypothetical protein
MDEWVSLDRFDLARKSLLDALSIRFNIRSSNIDILLSVLGIGTIIVLWALFAIYLLVRMTRSRRTGGYHKSKADRPTWIALLGVSGSVWIFTTLLYSGVLTIEPENDFYACGLLKYVGQYFFGWTLWMAAVNYKLIRKFYQFRVTKKRAPHALLAIALHLVPFALLAGLAVAFSRTFRDGLDICTVSHYSCEWLVPLYAGVLLFVGVFIFCAVKIRRTVGMHHEIIRYDIFLCSSFLFPAVDAIVQFVPLLDEAVWAGQLLTALAIILVLANLGHVYILVLRRKRPIAKTGLIPESAIDMGEDKMLEVESLASSDLSPEDETRTNLYNLNVMMTEGATVVVDAPPPSSTATGPVAIFNRARRSEHHPIEPSLDRYVDTVSPAQEPAVESIDRTKGYWPSTARRKTTRTVIIIDPESSTFRFQADAT